MAVRDYINQIKTSKDPNYCHRVTADDGALGEQHLRDFQDNEKSIPTILTTSQKLSTGVDARNIRNIVLMRPVNSMIEFKQIIGPRTRLFVGREQMAEMQKVIDAEKSDLFDVLAHVTYALAPLSREERAAVAKAEISARFSGKQQAFLNFVLSHYVSVGVE